LVYGQLDLNSPAPNGKTALHLACEQGQFRIVRLLLLLGADYSIKDIIGKTPLDLAKELKKLDVVGPWMST